MEVVELKWDGRPHRRASMHRLGDDRFGTWLWAPAGRTVYVGDEPTFVTEQDALMLFPATAWCSIGWWHGHPELEIYVNITTPAKWDDGDVVSVDLDLDVIRWNDGRVEIVDRSEFDVHRNEYGYPADVVAAAERAALTAERHLIANAPPFDGAAAATWRATAARRDLS